MDGSQPQRFKKYTPVEEDDSDSLSNVVYMAAGDKKHGAVDGHKGSAAEPAPMFDELRMRLLEHFQNSRVTPFHKLESYLTDLQEALKMSHISLVVMSQNHWLQTTLRRKDGAISLPSAAEVIHPYSFSRQMSEILEEEPSAVTFEYCVEKGLSPDLQQLADAEGLTVFVAHGVCNGSGEMIGALLFGHATGEPFADRAGWRVLHQTLQCIMYNTVVASNLERYVVFTETIKASATPQDMMVIISLWLPYLLLGAWGSCGECRIAIVRSPQVVTVYKGVRKLKSRVEGDTGSQKQEADHAKQFNLRRLSSTSKVIRTNSMSAAAHPEAQQLILGHANPLLDILQGIVPLEFENLAKAKDESTVYYKHLALKGTLLENVILNEVAVCIHDVQKHINDNPEGHAELLFNETVVLPKSLLLLPMYLNKFKIYGGIYLDCFIKHDLSHVQFEAEVFLLIASVVIRNIMAHTLAKDEANGDVPVAAEVIGTQQQALRSHLNQTIGQNRQMEHFSSRHNLVALQKVFTGIITDYSAYEEPPQICEPEQIHISSVAGRGAFGIVYQGWIEGVNTISAVKVMMLNDKMDGMALLRNATEMAAMSKINHPNTVHIMAHFMDVVMLRTPKSGSGPYFRRTLPEELGALKLSSRLQRCSVVVMEYCAYGTLLHAMNLSVFRLPEPSNAPDVAMICSVLLELGSALMFLHKHGIIHCDLKPQNVLLKVDTSNPRGFVTKLADFGLARVVTQSSPGLQGDSAGTPTHLAPEIVKVGNKPSWKTFKADVYAFGILMWELYTSEEAFSNVDKMHVLTKVALQRVRPKYPPDVLPAYASLSERCWDHEPDNRPSFDIIKAELNAIMEMHGGSVAMGNMPRVPRSAK